MKTKNNVQKTILTAIIILTGITIFNGSISAQGFLEKVNNSNDNPLAMKTDLSVKTNFGFSFASNSSSVVNLMEVENESPLEIEAWMITNFDKGDISKIDQTSKKIKVAEEVSVISEQEEIVYNTSTFVYRNLKDPALKFEKWMFDPKHWRAK